MTEQPFYKLCSYCAHYIQTIASKEWKVCTRYPTHIERKPDDTCGEWVCSRCWIPWDMVAPSAEDFTKLYIIDHSTCPEVNMDPKELIGIEMEED
jgi:hypothetical protein